MIKFVFRWAFRLIVLAIVLIVAAVLLKDTLIRNLTEQRIRQETGFDAKIGKLELNLFAPTIRIENCTLYNPPEFGGSPMLQIPELHVEYERERLALGRVKLKLLRLDLRELHVVESAAGRTNIIDFLGKAAPEALGATSEKKRKQTLSGVDMLNLSVGRVRFTSMRFPRRNQETDLGLRNEMIADVRSEEDLVGVLFKILLRAGITIYTDGESTKTHL